MSNLLNRDAQDALADKLEVNDPLNRWGNVISSFLEIPGLVGLWPMSSVQRSTGNCYDISGQGRTLTYNGNPVYDYENLTPFISLDGTGDYLRRADETDLDITGTETIFPADKRGLTLGGWYRFDNSGNAEHILAKDGAVGNRSYFLQKNNTDNPTFFVSVDGTALTSIISAETIPVDTWTFIVGRFDPSTELKIFTSIGGVLVKEINTTSIPASIFNSTAGFNLGRRDNNTNLMTGDASIQFLSANYLSDSIISGLFEQERILYGV